MSSQQFEIMVCSSVIGTDLSGINELEDFQRGMLLIFSALSSQAPEGVLLTHDHC